MSWRIAFCLLVCTSALAADERRFESGERQTALIELYTSEGCSSCPPAEAWLSRWKSDRGLWKNFVPLAFHVDYWDRLGWRDRFASRDWTQRQRAYATLLHSESVYTPQFVFNGDDWRDWSTHQPLKGDAKKAGVLSATTTDSKTFSIVYHNDDASVLEAHAALLGCGIESNIGAGENKGRKLQHDFVVLQHQSETMRNESGILRADLTLGSSNNDVPQKAVAIWITREKQLVPLQAAGGWLGKIASAK